MILSIVTKQRNSAFPTCLLALIHYQLPVHIQWLYIIKLEEKNKLGTSVSLIHCSRWLQTVSGTYSSLSLVRSAFRSSSFSRIRALTCSISSASSAIGSSWYVLASWTRGSGNGSRSNLLSFQLYMIHIEFFWIFILVSIIRNIDSEFMKEILRYININLQYTRSNTCIQQNNMCMKRGKEGNIPGSVGSLDNSSSSSSNSFLNLKSPIAMYYYNINCYW